MKKKLNPELNDPALTFVSSLCILFLGIYVLCLATDYGRSFTTEGYRRHQIALHPTPVPNLAMLDVQGSPVYLQDSVIQDGRFVILDFFYTSCRTICISQAAIFNALQEKIRDQHLEDRVRLVSISFDPEHDDMDAIQKYSAKVKADPSIWSLFTPNSRTHLQEVLDSFGIYVIKVEPFGDLDHNASFHLVDPQGKLIKISSLDDFDDLLSIVQMKTQHD
jgi:protein SCO1/2